MEREILLHQENRELLEKLLYKKLNLTRTEKEVFDLRNKGYKNEEIAKHLFISVHTFRNHIKNIRKKNSGPRHLLVKPNIYSKLGCKFPPMC